jgi:t-SNARE complex subunit (syntaxin)
MSSKSNANISKYTPKARDLLLEIQQEADRLPLSEVLKIPEQNSATDTNVKNTQNIINFMQRVSSLDELLDEINTHITNIVMANSKIRVAYTPDDTKKANDELNTLIESINSNANIIRDNIKKINSENKEFQERLKIPNIPPDEFNNITNDLRIRESHYKRLSTKFSDMMTHYDGIIADNKKKYVDTIKRSYRIANETSNISDDEIKQILDNGISDTFFGTIFSGRNVDLNFVESLVQDINDRHTDIVKLEKSLLELREIFLDMAVIVDSHSDITINIERSVEQSRDSVNKTVRHLAQAKKLQTSTRRKKICICTWLILIAGIIVLIVMLTR